MSKSSITIFAVALVGSSLALAAGSKQVIGMALAQGGASVDNAKVFGSATLFEGTSFRADGYSRLELSNGTRLDLGAGSQAQVFANHISLQTGSSEVQSGSGFEIEARSLTIRPDGDSIARVRMDGTQAVLVTALNAPVNVRNREGLLVARVMPNLPMSFVPQAGAAGSFSSTGCVVNKGGTALLIDDNKQVFQLAKTDARKMVGKRAAVKGTIDTSATPAGGATQVVNVSSITGASGGSCSDLAKSIGATTTAAGMAAGAAGAAGAAAGAGAATAAGVSAAVVGGVAAAAGAAVAVGVAVANNNSTSGPF